MFLTIPVLKLAQMKEEAVAVLVAHELAHFVLDHQVYRVVKAGFVNKVKDILVFKNAGFREVYDPTKQEFKEKVADKQKYSCFYPQQRVVTKFYEKNCDTFAIKFFMRAYPEADHEKVVGEVYGRLD